MKRIKTKSLCLILAVSLVIAMFGGCSEVTDNDIVILFTNDVHCGVEDDIGFAGLAAYRKSMEEKNDYVALVDCGDSIQGAFF